MGQFSTGWEVKEVTLYSFKKRIVTFVKKGLNGEKSGMGKAYGAWDHRIVRESQFYLRKMDLEITEQIINPNGQYIVFELKASNGTYKVFNIYALVNEYERVKFFNEISVLLCNNDESVEIIIGGDYNCKLNNAIDRYNCTRNIDIGRIWKMSWEILILRIFGEEETLMLNNFHGRGEERSQE